ncbi:hypothetical protein BCD48_28270 [Pseudofrankia sp. BMG5.36]|nr:hypothetical protein BCD48_28270 [Pseudofrankia sp. BMG5.36]
MLPLEECEGLGDELPVKLEDATVPASGYITRSLAGRHRAKSTEFVVGTIRSLSPLARARAGG